MTNYVNTSNLLCSKFVKVISTNQLHGPTCAFKHFVSFASQHTVYVYFDEVSTQQAILLSSHIYTRVALHASSKRAPFLAPLIVINIIDG